MQGTAMLSQANKCFTSAFFHSSCFRFSNPHACLKKPLKGSVVSLAVPHRFWQTLSWRRTYGSFVRASEGQKNLEEVAQKDHQQKLLQVVLVSPQIPGNSGSIARTCAATGVGLHLVEPLGYKIDDSKLKSAGLEYWPYVVVKVHKSWNDFFTYFQEQNGEKRLLAYTKNGQHVHTDVQYKPGDWLLFGSEVDGLPAVALEQCKKGEYAGGTIRLPMSEEYVRSLNLSISAGIGVYEALRQLDSHTGYSSVHVSHNELVFTENNDGYP